MRRVWAAHGTGREQSDNVSNMPSGPISGAGPITPVLSERLSLPLHRRLFPSLCFFPTPFSATAKRVHEAHTSQSPITLEAAKTSRPSHHRYGRPAKSHRKNATRFIGSQSVLLYCFLVMRLWMRRPLRLGRAFRTRTAKKPHLSIFFTQQLLPVPSISFLSISAKKDDESRRAVWLGPTIGCTASLLW